MPYRFFDLFFSIIGLFFSLPLLFLIFIIGLFDTGSPFFIQERVGQGQKPFKLIKFRTMSKDTKSVASHLANSKAITKLGRILRKTKLDELPQLINVITGDMSLVGPRPNLFNQYNLIKERTNLEIYKVLPGITGLAQISNIDMSKPALLAKTDHKMIVSMSIKNYFKYILSTVLGKGNGDRISS